MKIRSRCHIDDLGRYRIKRKFLWYPHLSEDQKIYRWLEPIDVLEEAYRRVGSKHIRKWYIIRWFEQYIYLDGSSGKWMFTDNCNQCKSTIPIFSFMTKNVNIRERQTSDKWNNEKRIFSAYALLSEDIQKKLNPILFGRFFNQFSDNQGDTAFNVDDCVCCFSNFQLDSYGNICADRYLLGTKPGLVAYENQYLDKYPLCIPEITDLGILTINSYPWR